jgi:protein SCO1/2
MHRQPIGRETRRQLSVALTLLLVCAACARGREREYELHGQVLAVDRSRQEITIKHDDIRGFMPGMTMPFKVRDAKLLDQRNPGDLVSATLVVEDTEGYLKAITATGHAPPRAAPPARPALDLLNPGDAIPDVALVDQDGTARRLSDWRGRSLAITFIYTRCPLPDFCPVMDRRFAEAQGQILDDAVLRERVHLASISFDPAFDTPQVLAAHAAKVGAHNFAWSFLTGAAADVEPFAARFGVSVIREGANASEVVHNLRTPVIDGSGRLVTVLTGSDWQASELIAALKDASGRR